jgi:hypothetical protein
MIRACLFSRINDILFKFEIEMNAELAPKSLRHGVEMQFALSGNDRFGEVRNSQ